MPKQALVRADREQMFANVDIVNVRIYETATGIILPTNRGIWPYSLDTEFSRIDDIREANDPSITIGELAVEYLKLRIQVIKRRYTRPSA